jgi:hypothetical protein
MMSLAFQSRAVRYYAAVVRVWCLAAFLCLSLFGAANRTILDVSNAMPGSPDGGSVLADAPSTDGPVDRRWEAVRPAACPSGSSWTAQTHHAVLARTPCQSVAGALRSDDVAAITTPRALRLQFRTPLLI